jgi:hypothetical protein
MIVCIHHFFSIMSECFLDLITNTEGDVPRQVNQTSSTTTSRVSTGSTTTVNGGSRIRSRDEYEQSQGSTPPSGVTPMGTQEDQAIHEQFQRELQGSRSTGNAFPYTTTPLREPEEHGGDSDNGKQRRYGIDFINPRDLVRFSPCEERRNIALGRRRPQGDNGARWMPEDDPDFHADHCIICKYALPNHISSNERPPPSEVYPKVEGETWRAMFKMMYTGLLERRMVDAAKSIAIMWNTLICASLNEENPNNKQLEPLTAALVYDHYKEQAPRPEMRELWTQIQLEDQTKELHEHCGIIKKVRGERGVLVVDHRVATELKDFYKLQHQFSRNYKNHK